MIVAITGAHGFIGQHLLRRFANAGWDARPVVRGDFASGAAHLARCFEGADVVVHAAGATRAPTHRELQESNVQLTGRVIEAAQRGSVGRLVLISSQAAAGPATDFRTPVDESFVPRPVEAYGKTKLDAERLLHSATGLPFVIVRPAAVYGPGDRDFFAMFRLARRGIALHPGNRSQWVSIIHVDDLVTGVMRASVDEHALGRTYFMTNPDPVQWGQLFRACASCIQRSLRLDFQFPRSVVRIGAAFGDVMARTTGRTSLLTSDKVALATPDFWICSGALAERELGVSPSIALSDGLRATHEWYATNGWL